MPSPEAINNNVQLGNYMDRMRPLVDQTIEKLKNATFREDPIGGRKYSRATSIMSSAYKRHGAIIHLSLLERLKDCARFRVWTEDDFKLSHESLQEIRLTERIEPLLRRRLSYGDRERAAQVDIIVFDVVTQTLKSYNIKRGNGTYDGGKRRIIQEDLLRTHMLLHDYGNQIGLDVKKAHSHIVFYYGLLSITKPMAISGDELDEHFGFPVQGAIEKVNQYFAQKLHHIIENEE